MTKKSNPERMVKLAEAYIKIKIDFNDDNISSIKKYLIESTKDQLTQIRISRGLETLDNVLSDFQVSKNIKIGEEGIICIIHFDEGSVKAKATFFGVLFFIYEGIGSYGDFRSGLSQIKEDLTMISENVIDLTKNSNAIVNNNLERTERRTGLVGRLTRTLNEIDRLRNQSRDLSSNQMQLELTKLHQDLANIIELLPTDEKRKLLDILPNDIKDNLPNPSPRDAEHFKNLYALKPEDLEDEVILTTAISN